MHVTALNVPNLSFQTSAVTVHFGGKQTSEDNPVLTVQLLTYIHVTCHYEVCTGMNSEPSLGRFTMCYTGIHLLPQYTTTVVYRCRRGSCISVHIYARPRQWPIILPTCFNSARPASTPVPNIACSCPSTPSVSASTFYFVVKTNTDMFVFVFKSRVHTDFLFYFIF